MVLNNRDHWSEDLDEYRYMHEQAEQRHLKEAKVEVREQLKSQREEVLSRLVGIPLTEKQTSWVESRYHHDPLLQLLRRQESLVEQMVLLNEKCHTQSMLVENLSLEAMDVEMEDSLIRQTLQLHREQERCNHSLERIYENEKSSELLSDVRSYMKKQGGFYPEYVTSPQIYNSLNDPSNYVHDALKNNAACGACIEQMIKEGRGRKEWIDGCVKVAAQQMPSE